jgi:hypothetical protein
MIDARRLVAPREHGGILVEPDAARIRACLARDAAAGYDAVPILDTTLGALRTRLRRRLGLTGPVILTGHQAGFGHAGVFAKTIAADALAASTDGVTMFLTVDSDVPKSRQLAVPRVEGNQLRRVFVDVPGCDPRLPSEWQAEVGLDQWADFFARVRSLWSGSDDSLLPAFAEGWLAAARPELGFCEGMIGAHAAVEETLGLGRTRDVRASQLCITPEFRAFVAHLALHAPALAAHYNQAQRAYRERYGVRNAQRPAPALQVSADCVELPFWAAWREQPRRRLYVADRGDALGFLAEGEQVGLLPKARLAQVEWHRDPWPIEADGWHIRLRALTLSAFTRLLVADMFIHGIGGAKYDRMTEDFVQRFFGVALAPMCCVSATMHLPLPQTGVSQEDVRAARRASRDIRYNPQRHLGNPPKDRLHRREESIQESATLKRGRPRDHAARARVFHEIQRLNDELLQCEPQRVDELDQRARQLEEQWRQDRIALDREYFFALHRRSDIEQLVQKVRTRLVRR